MSQSSRSSQIVAVVEADGRLALPDEVVRQVPLRPGDRVEVTLGRFGDPVREHWQQIAEYDFPMEFHRELAELLRRNREGALTADELQRLDTMVGQVEWQTVQRARALYELAQLGEGAA